jgi:hypothetical protein
MITVSVALTALEERLRALLRRRRLFWRLDPHDRSLAASLLRRVADHLERLWALGGQLGFRDPIGPGERRSLVPQLRVLAEEVAA